LFTLRASICLPDGDYFGQTVNLTSRIPDYARPGGVARWDAIPVRRSSRTHVADERRPDVETTSEQYHVAKLLIANQGIAIRASVTFQRTGDVIDSWELTGYLAGWVNFPMLLGAADIIIETVGGPTIHGPGTIAGTVIPGTPVTLRSSGPAEIDTAWVSGL
jgi:hypothetical protein